MGYLYFLQLKGVPRKETLEGLRRRLAGPIAPPPPGGEATGDWRRSVGRRGAWAKGPQKSPP
ncbi:MAG TPA: hypothetical protein PK777_05285 [Thermoguttaceae bacterium]|nr:hypothetical protein [Thermoguttaceae bacterium]